LETLLEAGKEGFSITEEPIQTIYLEQNKSSHFHPIKDSVRIYLPLIKFSLSSLTAALIDFMLLLMLHSITDSLLFSVITARTVSSAINFLANKNLVFEKGKEFKLLPSAVKYFALAAFMLFFNYGLIFLFTNLLVMPLIPAKLITELLLFSISYKIQKGIIFSTYKTKDFL
jgi:putative flippase GtrA